MTSMRLAELLTRLNDAGATGVYTLAANERGNLAERLATVKVARTPRSQEERIALQRAITDWWPLLSHPFLGCLEGYEAHGWLWAVAPDPLKPGTFRYLCTRCYPGALRLVPLSSLIADRPVTTLPTTMTLDTAQEKAS